MPDNTTHGQTFTDKATRRSDAGLIACGWALVLCAGIYYFSFVTADPDLWGHLMFGRDLWHSGQFPATDPYGFTSRGKAWINHEWAAELMFYGIYTGFGDAGLLLGKLMMGLLSVAGVYVAGGDRTAAAHPLIRFAVLVMVITALSPGYMIRPQLFSFLLFSLMLVVLYRYLDQHAQTLWALPLIMMVWVNLHGGFLIGWAILVLICGCETIRLLSGAAPGSRVRPLLGWSLAASLATFLNPYGYRLHAFLISSLSIPRDISEWNPLPIAELSYTNVKLMMGLSLVLMWRDRRRLRLWETVMVLATMAAAVRYQRHVPFFGMSAAVFLVHSVDRAVRDIRRKHRLPSMHPWVWRAAAAAMLLVGVTLAYRGGERYMLSRCRIIVDPRHYPVSAVSFLDINGFRGSLIVPFDWGEYALWKLYPRCRVSVDGRFRTAYPESVIRDHFFHPGDIDKWRRLLRRYPADLVLAVRHPRARSYLVAAPQWVYVYSDVNAMVFVRDNDRNRDLLKRFYTTGLRYEALESDMVFP